MLGTQKNHLNESVLLSTQKYMLKLIVKKILSFLDAQNISLPSPIYMIHLVLIL